jgi:hypothetical protein
LLSPSILPFYIPRCSRPERPQLLTGDTDENCNTNMGGIVFWDYAGFSMKVVENLCDPEREGMVNYFDFDMGYDGDYPNKLCKRHMQWRN